jgi:tetratricopeptide (TPR) repeat protein
VVDDDPGITPALAFGPIIGNSDGHGFSAGDIVANRFRVIEFLARGGMGEIYRARDLELGEDVALKIIRPEMNTDPATLRRFRDEARLSRQVTHVNVCRVFDVFSHWPNGKSSTPVLVLTMEFLRGETIASRIRRCGRVPHEDALRILRQIAHGLEAAHSAGILHLDLTSNNVFLVPQAHGVRAVVADFGLAEALQELAGSTRSPRDAPDLAREHRGSQPPSAATDVYALALLAYEMLTGERFTGTPGKSDPHDGLSREQRTAIGRALEVDPSKRFTAPSALVSALYGRRTLLPPWRALTVISLLLLVGLGWIAARLAEDGVPADGRRPTAILIATKTEPTKLAITAELNTLLATWLGAGERLRLDSSRDGASTEQSHDCSSECLDAIGKKLGGDYVIAFKVDSLAPPLIGFGLLARDLRRHRTIEVKKRGEIGSLPVLVEEAAAEAREKLSIPTPLPAESTAARALLPQSAEGLRLYVTGKDSIHRGNASAAADALATLVRLEPRYAMGHVALADALAHLGFHERAISEYRAALPLGGEMPRRELLLIQARAHEGERHWDAAAAVYHALVSSSPDDQTLQIALATALAAGGHCRAARATLAVLRHDVVTGRYTLGSDLEVSLVEATTSEQCHDWKGEKAAAQRAVRQAESLGANADLASARQLLAWATAETGDINGAKLLEQQVLAQAAQSGNLELQFRAERSLAAMARDRGDFHEAESRLSGLVNLARTMRNPDDEGLVQRSLGALHIRMGRLDDAVAANKRALALFASTEEHDLEALSLNSLAIIAEMKDDYPEALRLYEQALPLLRRAGDSQGVGAVLANAGRVHCQLGATQEAHRELSEGARLLESHHDIQAADSLTNLALLEIEMGELAGADDALRRAAALRSERPSVLAWLALARARLAFERAAPSADSTLQQAISIFVTSRDKDGEGWALTALAAFEIDRREFGVAMATARHAEDACRQANDAPCKEGALVTRAEAAWQSGQLGTARAAIRQALSSQDKLVMLHAREVEALLVAAGGSNIRSDRLLASAIDEAARSGFATRRAASQLARGRVSEQAGKTGPALRLYGQVAAECKRLGMARLEHAAIEATNRLTNAPRQSLIEVVGPPNPRL